MKTLNDLREAVENKTATVLTIEIATKLKGKRISTIYFGYNGQDGKDNFIIGEIISEYDRAKANAQFSEVDSRFNNQAEWWESYMTPAKLTEYKNKMMLFTADGRNTFIFAHPDNFGAFTCSDRDRFVFYVED